MNTYIIKTGSMHYSLYKVVSISAFCHIVNLDIKNYSRIAALKEFKRLLNINVFDNDNGFYIEFK